MTIPPAVEIENLTRTFGGTTALDGVDLTVHRGEVHALLGPNGAGKTTLIRIATGAVRPTSGAVRVMGVAWSELSKRSSRTLFGLVSSGDRSAYHRLSGLENLIFFGRLYGMGKHEAKNRAMEVLEQVGLADAALARAGVYSHGMQKRLTLARAILMDPPVLLVDEATHDLDPAGARMVRTLLRDAAQRGTAILWATQRVDEIQDTATRLTILDRGKRRFVGTVDQLAKVASGRRYLLELTGAVTVLGENRHPVCSWLEPGNQPDGFTLTLPDGVSLGEAIASLHDLGVNVTQCRQTTSEVEDAFLTLTGSDLK